MRKRRLAVVAGVLGTLAVTLVVISATVNAPIADAAERGDVTTVADLIRRHADVNAAQGDGMTALHWAALNGDLKLVNALLVAKPHLDALTRIGGYTPLHLASSRGHGAVVARLVDAGSAVSTVTATGVQPIHLAAEAGSVDAVRAILGHGADINAKDATHGRTPLIFAVSANRLDVMKLLIAKSADVQQTTTVIDYMERSTVDNKDKTARDVAVAQTTGKRITGPLLGNVDPNDPNASQGVGRGRATGPRPPTDIEVIGTQGGFTALHYAVRDGYADAVAVLLAAGADVNRPSAGDLSTPLNVAAINGQYDLALLLIGNGANPKLANDDGVTPLFATINNEWALRTWYPQPTAGTQQQASYLQLMESLLKAGADPNARTRSHIWYASYNTGRMGVDFGGATPFWRAAYALDVDAMRMLVKYGADPNVPTKSFGNPKRANDLSGLDAVPPGGPHVPAFHAASGVGYGTSRVAQQHRHVPDGWMAAAKYFVEELKVDVNIRDAEGFTALHHAAARGDNAVILYLLKHGADVLAVNRAGQTTVDMANSPEQRTQPFPDTIKLLEGLGAKNNHNCQACK